MCVMNITDNYDSLINRTDNKNGDINIIVKFLLLSKPENILLFFLLGLVIYTKIEPLLTNKWWWRKFHTQPILLSI